jgi:hypothetical protein
MYPQEQKPASVIITPGRPDSADAAGLRCQTLSPSAGLRIAAVVGM